MPESQIGKPASFQSSKISLIRHSSARRCTSSLIHFALHFSTADCVPCLSCRLLRSILADKPRVTRFPIEWDPVEQVKENPNQTIFPGSSLPDCRHHYGVIGHPP